MRTAVAMGTFVSIDAPFGCGAAIARAFGWFREIEERCSRFDPRSELAQLAQHVGEAVPASPILFEAVAFAMAVAEETNGAFDPTVGAAMEARGFNRNYSTGQRVTIARHERVSYRDVVLDPDRQTIMLRRPLMLDLGAVAKGLAIDMAARELASCAWFAIDAGGDLFVGGSRHAPEPMRIGIRHPRIPDRLIATVQVVSGAVCTSGDYERRTPAGHHILDPRQRAVGSGQSADTNMALTADRRLATVSCSATVIAPNAMLADALATAAFVLGGADGIRLLERHGVEGLIVSADGERYATARFDRLHTFSQDAQGTADDRPRAAAGDRDSERRNQGRRAGPR